MASKIKTVAVIGSGVIGAGWASLFLATGRRVLLSDPAPGSREKFDRFLQNVWPVFERIGLKDKAHRTNYEFLDVIKSRLVEADFVQEVRQPGQSGCDHWNALTKANLEWTGTSRSQKATNRRT